MIRCDGRGDPGASMACSGELRHERENPLPFAKTQSRYMPLLVLVDRLRLDSPALGPPRSLICHGRPRRNLLLLPGCRRSAKASFRGRRSLRGAVDDSPATSCSALLGAAVAGGFRLSWWAPRRSAAPMHFVMLTLAQPDGSFLRRLHPERLTGGDNGLLSARWKSASVTRCLLSSPMPVRPTGLSRLFC